ncbi:MAG: type II 3-dehydroquinate dehydratase [Actinobacteria bacterium]|jgi:3-dehydroquinate dehydratase-2|nr:MAG: type II 3-dehydroquinate dehydratase [Actinomycetota bacterium]
MNLITVVNGPNLNMLGEREPDVYGRLTWEEIKKDLEEKASGIGCELEFFQSNHEGAIIDYLQGIGGRASGLIVNPGALTHYGYSLRDALAALDLPAVEVHLTNIYAREDWRAYSVISPVVKGVISGCGPLAYGLALEFLCGNASSGNQADARG